MLGNIQSVLYKAEELRACVQCLSDYRQSCLIRLSETWLTETDHTQLLIWRASQISLFVVYIGPSADVKEAANIIYELIAQAEAKAPNAAERISDDFSLCSLTEL